MWSICPLQMFTFQMIIKNKERIIGEIAGKSNTQSARFDILTYILTVALPSGCQVNNTEMSHVTRL
jgi:hypothetical protein